MQDLSTYTEYKNLKKFEDLICVSVITFFEFPVVALYKDVLGNLFLIAWVDCETVNGYTATGIDRWVVTPIKEGQVANFTYITDSNPKHFIKAYRVPREQIPYGYNTGERDYTEWLRKNGVL